MDTSREHDLTGRDARLDGLDRTDRLGESDRLDGTDRLDDAHAFERDADGRLTVTARAERLLTGTERVESGRLVVRRRIITEERHITVQVQREEIVVEHVGDTKLDEVTHRGEDLAAAGTREAGTRGLDDTRGSVPRRGEVDGRGADLHGGAAPLQSRVVAEYVLHEAVPRVEFDVVPRENVRIVVDTYEGLREVTETVGREHIVVEGADGVASRIVEGSGRTGQRVVGDDEPVRVGDREDLDERRDIDGRDVLR